MLRGLFLSLSLGFSLSLDRLSADADFGAVAVESWVDAIRLGDGTKEKLPEGIVVSAIISTVWPSANSNASRRVLDAVLMAGTAYSGKR
jgi:hypothetical protein